MTTLTFATLLAAPALLAQSVEFTEVLINPVGPNAGAQIGCLARR